MTEFKKISNPESLLVQFEQMNFDHFNRSFNAYWEKSLSNEGKLYS